MEAAIIYTLDDPITGEIRYVGKTTYRVWKRRYRKHLKIDGQTHKVMWVQSLLQKGFKPIMTVLDEVEDRDWEFWETYYIELLKTWGINLTNSTPGGEGRARLFGEKNHMFGRKYTQEELKIRSILSSGENNGNYGKRHSEETKKKISDKRIGRKMSEEVRLKMMETKKMNGHHMTGKHHNEDTKKKIGDANRGKRKGFVMSEEHKRKISEGRKRHFNNIK